MTTITSNKNEFSGKVHSNKPTFDQKYDYSNRSSCGGYVLLFALIAVLVVIVVFVVTHS